LTSNPSCRTRGGFGQKRRKNGQQRALIYAYPGPSVFNGPYFFGTKKKQAAGFPQQKTTPTKNKKKKKQKKKKQAAFPPVFFVFYTVLLKPPILNQVLIKTVI